jgi:hypothetical protein
MVSLDSIDNEKIAIPGDFDLVLPWQKEDSLYFFPNDTGAGMLAIGFESIDTISENDYTGFVNINRDNFVIKSLITHDQNPQNYDRLSYVYDFGTSGGYIVLDKMEMQGIIGRFFGNKYLRHIFYLNDYRLLQ